MQSIPIHIVAIALLLMQARPSQTIIGKWESVEASAEGGCPTMEFGPRGVLYLTFAICHSGTYRLDGGGFLLEEGASSRASEAVEFRIESDKLVFKDAFGEEPWPRIGRPTPNAPAIIGKWGVKGTLFHGDNGYATFEFTQDGHYKFRMQGEPKKARYQTRGERLIIWDSGESTIYSFRFKDEFLILTSGSSPVHEENYRRIER